MKTLMPEETMIFFSENAQEAVSAATRVLRGRRAPRMFGTTSDHFFFSDIAIPTPILQAVAEAAVSCVAIPLLTGPIESLGVIGHGLTPDLMRSFATIIPGCKHVLSMENAKDEPPKVGNPMMADVVFANESLEPEGDAWKLVIFINGKFHRKDDIFSLSGSVGQPLRMAGDPTWRKAAFQCDDCRLKTEIMAMLAFMALDLHGR